MTGRNGVSLRARRRRRLARVRRALRRPPRPRRAAAWASSTSPTRWSAMPREILDVLREPHRRRRLGRHGRHRHRRHRHRVPGRAGDRRDGCATWIAAYFGVFSGKAAAARAGRAFRRGARRPAGAGRARAGGRHVGQARRAATWWAAFRARARARCRSPTRWSRGGLSGVALAPQVGGRDAPHAGLLAVRPALPRHRMRGQHHRHARRPAGARGAARGGRREADARGQDPGRPAGGRLATPATTWCATWWESTRAHKLIAIGDAVEPGDRDHVLPARRRGGARGPRRACWPS